MAKSKDIVQIDLSAMALIEQDGDKFLLDPKAEDALLKLVELKQQIEVVETAIKERLMEAMKKTNCIKIEGNGVKVARRYFGERFEVFDQAVALQIGVAKEVTTIKADSKEIEKYQKDTGELPDGIKLKERTESVTISAVKEK